MSQIENKMDDFEPFGGKARTEYQEDELAIPHATSAAVINALDEIMFPKDEQGEWSSECQTYFAVQRLSSTDENRDYFLLGGDGLLSCVDQIEDETPFSRDGADWGECGGDLAFKVYSEPPTLLTFHELTPAGLDLLRDEDGFFSDVPSEAVEKVFGDETLTMPSMLTLLEVELKVDDALAELETQPEATESLDELVSAKTNHSEIINANWANSILVKGGNRRYNEPCAGITVYENFKEAISTEPSWRGRDNIFADCETIGIWDENGSLFVTGAHHDGRACVEMRQLTDKGESLYSDYKMEGGFYLPEDGVEAMGFVYREGDESAFIHDLWDNPEMCSHPRFAEKALGYPAEEYTMDHEGVKTEFQISEVKEGSFAYEQGARFDVKVLTDGHDCGNGRFCADLGEAHDFCQQFANEIVGVGESLDDMCENRREVASVAQDVDAEDCGLEDKNHDNSEIGE